MDLPEPPEDCPFGQAVSQRLQQMEKKQEKFYKMIQELHEVLYQNGAVAKINLIDSKLDSIIEERKQEEQWEKEDSRQEDEAKTARKNQIIGAILGGLIGGGFTLLALALRNMVF